MLVHWLQIQTVQMLLQSLLRRKSSECSRRPGVSRMVDLAMSVVIKWKYDQDIPHLQRLQPLRKLTAWLECSVGLRSQRKPHFHQRRILRLRWCIKYSLSWIISLQQKKVTSRNNILCITKGNNKKYKVSHQIPRRKTQSAGFLIQMEYCWLDRRCCSLETQSCQLKLRTDSYSDCHSWQHLPDLPWTLLLLPGWSDRTILGARWVKL